MATNQQTPQQIERGKIFIEKANACHQHKFDYTLMEYRYASQKITIICPVHGPWEQRPNDHLMGCGCPRCKFDKISSQKRHTAADFIHKATQIHGATYDYSLVQYTNATTKVEIVCPTHGSFWQTPDKHTTGSTACPQCSQQWSRGEKRIAMFLDNAGITYEREKRFDGLVGTTNNSRLRFDFFIPAHNTLIEFDGEHHFMPVRTKGRLSHEQAVDKHNRCVANDAKKTLYACDHGYNLIRIKYDEDIEARLLDHISRQWTVL